MEYGRGGKPGKEGLFVFVVFLLLLMVKRRRDMHRVRARAGATARAEHVDKGVTAPISVASCSVYYGNLPATWGEVVTGAHVLPHRHG